MRLTVALAALGSVLGAEPPVDRLVFADAVVSFEPGWPAPAEAYADAAKALGAPDYDDHPVCQEATTCTFVSLGNGGRLTLGFTSPFQAGDGTAEPDLWIYEVGPAVEATLVEVSPDGTYWIPVGQVRGSQRGLDLDAVGLGPGLACARVRLTDDPEEGANTGPSVGADIDAVAVVRPQPPSPDPGAASFRTRLLAWGQYVSTASPQPPGNSLEAIVHAQELGYDGIELDLRLTQDEIPILLHDDVLDTTTDGHGPVANYTFAESQQFSLGTWRGVPVRIPKLEDALRQHGTNGFFLGDLRIGGAHAAAVAGAVLRSGVDTARLWFSVYTPADGLSLRSRAPGVRVALKCYAYPHDLTDDWIDAAAAAGMDGVMLQIPEDCQAIRGFVDHVHCQGLKLILFVNYSFNSLAQLQSAIDVGADYVLTMHAEFRRLIRWPDYAQTPPPPLRPALNPGDGCLILTWSPSPPHAYVLETSADLFDWTTVRQPFHISADSNLIDCAMPTSPPQCFYRLRYRP